MFVFACVLLFAGRTPAFAGDACAWEGAGTTADPYQLATFDDVESLRICVNEQHETFENTFFIATADIAFPASWPGLGEATVARWTASEMHAFSGTIDGAGHTFEFATGAKPLFAYVDNTTVRNLKVHGTFVTGTALVENYVRYAYTTGAQRRALTAENVTLAAGSSTFASGFIGGFAGMENDVLLQCCKAEQGVRIGWDASAQAPSGLSRIGSFAGDFNGRIVGCTSAASVYGADYVGGIVGSKGQSMGTYEVDSCAFTGEVEATGVFVGGIAGGGYAGSDPFYGSGNPFFGVMTAQNTRLAVLKGNYVSGSVTGGANVGGIYGGEQGVVQAWDNGIGTIAANAFYGSVAATDASGACGGIVGYMNSLNRYTVFADNYFKTTCAASGIGAVHYVDTNCSSHETESGAVYYDTSIAKAADANRPQYATKQDHYRTDDPLGANVSELTTAFDETAFADGTVLGLLAGSTYADDNWRQGEEGPVFGPDPVLISIALSGKYQTVYYVGDVFSSSGLIVTAGYSDGSTRLLDVSRVAISGFDTSAVGKPTVTVSYGAASASFSISVLPASDRPVTVTFSLMGDSCHGEDGTTHLLKAGTLQTWIAPTRYEMSPGATVLDLIERSLSEHGYTFDINASGYISSVTTPAGLTLEAFDNGSNSGWMYTVNGQHPGLGVGDYLLEDGDVVIFHYTDDYLLDDNLEIDGGQGTDAKGEVQTAKTVRTVTVNTKTVSAASVKKAMTRAGANVGDVTKVILGKKVKTIKRRAFKKCAKLKVLVVKTKKLTKKRVRGCLKGAKVKTVQVKVGSKKTNKKYVKKYRKVFAKKICGKKVKVK